MKHLSFTTLGRYVVKNRRNLRNNSLGPLFESNLLPFLKNESIEVFNKLINGEDVAIAGLNTDIDEILPELQIKCKRITF